MGMRMRKLLVLATAGCGLWAAVAVAQAQSAEAAPPDRVARLAVIDGSASLLPAGSQNWGNASINRRWAPATSCGYRKAAAHRWSWAAPRSALTATAASVFCIWAIKPRRRN